MIFRMHNSFLTVDICDTGAELYSIKNSDGTEYLWQGNPKYWKSRASNLFPICGRLFGGKYTYNGKTYEMNAHGFARASVFTPVVQAENNIVFELKSSEATHKIYPFDFSLRISYTLNGKNLICEMVVKNTGKDTLPFSVGGHPGFNVPLAPGLAFEDYYLEFSGKSSPEMLVLSETCYLTGRTAPFALRDGKYIDLSHSLFDHDAIFLLNMPSSVTLKTDKDKHSVTLTYPGAKYLGFWHTTKSDAPFVCIEPWAGTPAHDGVIDDFATKADMNHVSPGDVSKFSFTITTE